MKVSIPKRTYAGAFALVLGVVLFFVAEYVTSLGWVNPDYSYISNWISDLGVPIVTDAINSPFYILMNFMFVTYGILSAVSYWLIKPFLPKGIITTVATVLLAMQGIGWIIVGIFPGYDFPLQFMHGIGASAIIYCGNVGSLLLGIKLLRGKGKKTGVLGIVLGIGGLISSFAMFALAASSFGGLLERITVYAPLVWSFALGSRILFGKGIQEE